MKLKYTIFLLFLVLQAGYAFPFTHRLTLVRNHFKLNFTDTPACPLINETNVRLFCSSADKPDGSVTGLKVAFNGNLTYSWQKDGVEVGSNLNLVNVSAGKYRLAVTAAGKSKLHRYFRSGFKGNT